MNKDEAISRSVLIGHTVKGRLRKSCPNISNDDLEKVQYQVELAYLQAIIDISLDLAARSNMIDVTC
jgi:hypothetical protein